MELKYCITCEEDVIVEDGMDGHAILVWKYPFEVDFCYGPFAFVHPPVNFEEDFDLHLVEPDGDEMFIINKNADDLMYDLGIL